MIQFAFAGQRYETDRVIGSLESDKGPVVVFVGGMHGNEPSGVIAIKEVFAELNIPAAQLGGSLLGLAGNLRALEKNQRFVSCDLNRIWQSEFDGLQEVNESTPTEFQERGALDAILRKLLKAKRPLIVVDLHTTSSRTIPFLVVSNSKANVAFSKDFVVPRVLGLEKFLHGPMLNYIDTLGHRTMAFEAGQHDDPESVKIHKAFIYSVLLAAKVVGENSIPEIESHRRRLADCCEDLTGSFEVVFRKQIGAEDEFTMNPGYQNFSEIQKEEWLASDRSGKIYSGFDGRIFMPLYQNAGEDGFFVVQPVSVVE